MYKFGFRVTICYMSTSACSTSFMSEATGTGEQLYCASSTFLTCCAILPTSFVAMTGRTVYVDGPLAEVFRGFPQQQGKCLEICAQTPISSHYPYYYLTDVSGMTLGASVRWLGTRTGAGGTATLA